MASCMRVRCTTMSFLCSSNAILAALFWSEAIKSSRTFSILIWIAANGEQGRFWCSSPSTKTALSECFWSYSSSKHQRFAANNGDAQTSVMKFRIVRHNRKGTQQHKSRTAYKHELQHWTDL